MKLEGQICPAFAICLFDAKGLILGYSKQENTTLALSEKQYRIVVDATEEPKYFKLEFID
jgi:hypothetical protein